jgi:hypothetical protein
MSEIIYIYIYTKVLANKSDKFNVRLVKISDISYDIYIYIYVCIYICVCVCVCVCVCECEFVARART